MELRYKQIGDQFYPELELPEQTDYEIGKYGNLHLAFLKNHRRGTYTTLLQKAGSTSTFTESTSKRRH